MTTEKYPREEEEIVPLDEGPIMDTYNMNYNEIQNKTVQARKKHFPDNFTSLTFIRGRVIVTNTRRNPNSIATTNLAFTSATNSNTNYMTTVNKQLENNVQATWQEV